jgi:mRNA interferase MazF
MSGGIMYSQRDIVLVPFPYSDLTGAKLRPALIISNDSLAVDKICCLVTSKPGAGIAIKDFESGKLPFRSWAKPYRLFTINERLIKRKLCRVRTGLHNKIISEVNTYLKNG